jgi:hypothetical protein
VSSSAQASPPAAGALLRGARLPWPLLAPVLASTLVCAVALVIRPRTVDLAAHVYRSVLFQQEGFTIWDGNWYGGHHSPAYSVIFPPLGALLGPLVVGAIAAIATTACFAALARRHWGDSAAFWGTVWFGAGSATILFTGRVPFGLGVMFGVAALLAEQRGRRTLAIVLAACCPLASPVAGLFFGIAAAAMLLSGGEQRRRGLLLGIACAVPLFSIALAFPEGAHEPFDFSTFWPLPLLMAAFIALLPRDERTLRIGAAIYAVSSIVFYFASTAMGGNSVRLGALFAGPVLACALAGRWPRETRRRWALGVLLLAFAFWQWSPAVRDTNKALEDPATKASYYKPLLDELDRRADSGQAVGRIEIPFTRSHWEAAEVARHYPLARGWERQLDIPRNGIFYGGVLNATTYGTWLAEHGVSYVAVASVKPDYSSYRERALIEAGLPYLREVWHDDHWRLFAVTLPHAIVVAQGDAEMTLASLRGQSFTIDVRRPGTAAVKVQWSQYWKATGGCVERDGEWTRVSATRPGKLRVGMSFSLARVFSHGRRCG